MRPKKLTFSNGLYLLLLIGEQMELCGYPIIIIRVQIPHWIPLVTYYQFLMTSPRHWAAVNILLSLIWQRPISKSKLYQSHESLTINTPRGLYHYIWLPVVVKTTPADLKKVDTMTSGLPGTGVHLGDRFGVGRSHQDLQELVFWSMAPAFDLRNIHFLCHLLST